MDSGINFLWMMIQTVVALAVVCGLAYLLFRVVLPRFSFIGSGKSMVRIVDRVSIDPRKSLCVVEVAGKWLLVSVSDNGVQMVSELDPESARAAEKELLRGASGKKGLQRNDSFSRKIADLVGKERESE